jgi:ATP-dependent Clp protease ATP-binding subunit ClpB
MNMNKFTQKSQEALQEAQSTALRYKHGEVDAEHLLLILLVQEDGLLPRILQRMGVPVEGVRVEIENGLTRRPRVSGPGAELHMTRRLQQILVTAEDEAKALKDEYSTAKCLERN